MANQHKVTRTRKPRWDGEVDKHGRRYSTGRGGKRRRSVPVVENMIVTLELPQGFTLRNTKGVVDHPDGINYEEYQILITDHNNPAKDSFIKVNSFIGPDAAGKKVKARVKVGTEDHWSDGKKFQVYYLKLEPCQEDEPETHAIQVLRNRLAIDDAKKVFDPIEHHGEMDTTVVEERALLCDAAALNPNMDGAILIVSEGALTRLEAQVVGD